MAKQTIASLEAESVPVPPEPTAGDLEAGRREGAELASRYLPNCVRLLAAVAFGTTTAKLHTRVLAAGSLIDLSGIQKSHPSTETTDKPD